MFLLGLAPNVQAIGLLGAGSVVAYFLAKYLFKVDTAVEDYKRRAIDLSAWCQNNGLPLAGKLLNCFVVGDQSGLVYAVKDILNLLANPVEAQAAVDRFLNVQLDKKLATVEGKESLIAAIEKKLNVKINRDSIVLASEPVALEAPKS